MKRVFVIHGWEAKAEEGWRPWLKMELEKLGYHVGMPQMPHATFPKLDEWLEVLQELVRKSDKDTYFVGHSLGCYTILKFIESLPTDQKVGGAVLVSGFAGELKHNIPILEKFYELGLDWQKIKAHGGKYAAIYSERDDYVHVHSAREFEEKLGAKLVKNSTWKHFSAVEGIKQLPEALEALKSISDD